MEASEAAAPGPPPAGGETPRREVLLALPGIAAVFLGALYAIGALLKMADLWGAGLRVRDSLPLVPLEELLSRGIGTAILLTALLALGLLHISIEKFLDAPAHTVSEDVYGLIVLVIFALGGILAIAVLPWIVGTSLLGGVVLMFLVGRWVPLRPVWWITASVVVGLVIYNFAAPAPLPHADLLLDSHQRVEGGLVTIADSDWYVARGDAVEVFQADQIEAARVSSVGRRSSGKSLVEVWAWFWVPVGLIAVTSLLLGVGGVSSARKAARRAAAARAEPQGADAPEGAPSSLDTGPAGPRASE